MHICLVCSGRIPVLNYGGTQRLVHWLAQEYVRRGHRVTLVAAPGSRIDGVQCLPATDAVQAQRVLPRSADIVHFHAWQPPPGDWPRSWLFTLHGNTSQLHRVPAHTVCLSADHARRHQRTVFVYNGIDPAESVFREDKQDYLLFLSKIRRRGKGARRALALARQARESLVMAGGRRWDLLKTGGLWDSFRPGVRVVGEVGGAAKAALFANAKAFLFPIDWEEPFGLVLIEALMSGTPVVATPRGAVRELVPPHVGALFERDEDFPQALAQAVACRSRDCRDWAMTHFSAAVCARHYLTLYQRLCDGEAVFAAP
jgi:glycosyltransferase involved in cell wall biosynthesis